MCETQCKCAKRKGLSGTKLLVIVAALVLTAGSIFVYAGTGANRGTAWYAENVMPVSGHLAAGQPDGGRIDGRRRQVCQGHVAGVPPCG